jgi:hypothetical protein
MLGVLGLLTGWVLISPALIVLYLQLGLPYQTWMAPFAGIAMSVPMLGFSTVGGIAMIVWSVIQLTRREDDLAPPH